jgi:hypothetical protein
MTPMGGSGVVNVLTGSNAGGYPVALFQRVMNGMKMYVYDHKAHTMARSRHLCKHRDHLDPLDDLEYLT